MLAGLLLGGATGLPVVLARLLLASRAGRLHPLLVKFAPALDGTTGGGGGGG